MQIRATGVNRKEQGHTKPFSRFHGNKNGDSGNALSVPGVASCTAIKWFGSRERR
jgi:hypothetical protein